MKPYHIISLFLICIIGTIIFILNIGQTPTMPKEEVQNAIPESSFLVNPSFDVEMDGVCISSAVVVEDGVHRILSKEEYTYLMETELEANESVFDKLDALKP